MFFCLSTQQFKSSQKLDMICILSSIFREKSMYQKLYLHSRWNFSRSDLHHFKIQNLSLFSEPLSKSLTIHKTLLIKESEKKKPYQIIDVIFCIFSLLFRHIKEEFEDLFSEDDLMQMEHDQIAFTWYT